MKALRRAFKAVPTQRPAAQAEHRWLRVALLLSLLFHALLLSLTFSGQGPGLPGLGLPWQERRGQAPELRVVLLPAPAGSPAISPPPNVPSPALAPVVAAAAPVVKLPEGQAVVPALVLARSTAAGGAPLTAAVPALSQLVAPAPVLLPKPAAVPMPMPTPEPVPEPRADAVEAALSAAALKPTPAPEPALMTTQRPDAASLISRTTPQLRAPLAAAAPELSSPQEVAKPRVDESAAAQQRMQAQRQAALAEAQRQAAQLEAQRQAALVEAQRQAALVEAQRQAALVEAQRQAALVEAARAEAARQDGMRQELARQEAAKQENTRREAERAAQVLRQEAENQDAARQTAAKQAAARIEAAQQDDARREASRRAMGRQLDEEAAKRDAARAGATSAPPGLPPAASSLRRGRLLGRTDANTELVLYAEAWARKIQLNMTFELVREATTKPHTQPVVTVSIRSDGSVESVLLVRSSGVPDIDEAVQRIVRSQAPYPAFSPALASEFDVIEIRRTWHFDSAVRLY